MYEKVKRIVEIALSKYLKSKGFHFNVPIRLMKPPDFDMGDYASNIAILLAEREGRKALEIAKDISSFVEDKEGLLAEEPVIAGKGFLNFKIKKERWFSLVPLLRESGEALFFPPGSERKKINVEFVSANPTGPLHVGHGRGAVIGDTLVRLLRATGNEVCAEYYVNDRGKQIRTLGVSLHYRYNKLFNSDFPEPSEEEWYRGEYLTQIAEELKKAVGDSLRQKGSHCPEFSRFASKMLEDKIREDLAALDINFDRWFYESSITDSILWGNINYLIEKGFAVKNEDDSISFKMEGFELADPKERILVKKGGRDFTYFGTDISYHLDKISRGFDKLINIWGADHHGYIPRMKGALKAFGYDPEILKVILVQMVSLSRDGQPIKMSKRSGEFVTLREIVDEVGKDAFRLIFLMRRPDSQFDFDIEEAKKRSLHNPVYHVQYGHARLCSILNRAKEKMAINIDEISKNRIPDLLMEKLTLEEEVTILRESLKLSDVVNDSVRTFEPHRVATFIMDLSKMLQSYYTQRWRVYKDPILPPDSIMGSSSDWKNSWDMEKTMARLIWADSIREVFRTSLNLLGVSAPERMESPAETEIEEEDKA